MAELTLLWKLAFGGQMGLSLSTSCNFKMIGLRVFFTFLVLFK